MNTQLSRPEADDHGFMTFEALARHAQQRTADQFVREFPDPGLLVVYREDNLESGELLDPRDTRVQLLTISIKSAAILRYLNRITFVRKRPGNLYAHLIAAGRSANNDIVIQIDTVSKVHGYFVHDEAGWCFTDHSSTNGSRLNQQPLVAGTKYSLQSHDILQLGLEVMLEFLQPEKLYLRLRDHA